MSKSKYRSCCYVEGALILHPKKIFHCCIPVKGKFGDTLISEFMGGNFPIDKIIESRNKYRKMFSELENHKDFHCYDCPHHHVNEWDNKYLFNNIHFNHSILCNLKCNNCVQRSWALEYQKPSYDILPIVKTLTSTKNILSPDAFIFWAGGEPTLVHDFEESLQLMINHGVKNEIATNSTIFSEVVFKNLKPDGNLILKTSIDCGTAEKYFQKKKKDWYYRVWENLGKYALTGADVAAKYILSTDNCEESELNAFVEQVKKHNIKSTCVDIDHNLTPAEVSCDIINAAVTLTRLLENESVCVDVGLHGMSSVPDFRKKVNTLKHTNIPCEVDSNTPNTETIKEEKSFSLRINGVQQIINKIRVKKSIDENRKVISMRINSIQKFIDKVRGKNKQ